jgi:hypothetical protein
MVDWKIGETIEKQINNSNEDEFQNYLKELIINNEVIYSIFNNDHPYDKHIIGSKVINILISSQSQLTDKRYLSACAELLLCLINLKDINLVEELLNKCQINHRKLVNKTHEEWGFEEKSFEWLYQYPYLLPDNLTLMLVNVLDGLYSDDSINKILAIYQYTETDSTDELIGSAIYYHKPWILEYILERWSLPIKTKHFISAVQAGYFKLIDLFITRCDFNPNSITLHEVCPKPNQMLNTILKLQNDYQVDPFIILAGLVSDKLNLLPDKTRLKLKKSN